MDIKNVMIILGMIIFITGCGNGEDFTEEERSQFAASGLVKEDITFDQIKSEILNPRCTTCHSKYGTYENVRDNIQSISAMIKADFMPKDGPLSLEEKELFFSWVDAGMPESLVNKDQASLNDTVRVVPLTQEERLTFQNLKDKVFQPYCMQCHGNFDQYDIVKSKIDNIVNFVRQDIMPMGGKLPDDLKALLFEWAAAGAPDVATGPTTPIPTPIPLVPTYESLNKHVFSQKCVACHNPNGRAAFLDLSSYEAMVRNKKRLFDFRRPWKSDIIDDIIDEPMPPRNSPFASVTQEELNVLVAWIKAKIPRG